ncbi:protein STPG4-like [Diadema setosum]|uniref:protein STPG4-like n=1 Tax=Diadema setosum TaxID=31175 RepID=UPI003B3AB8C7
MTMNSKTGEGNNGTDLTLQKADRSREKSPPAAGRLGRNRSRSASTAEKRSIYTRPTPFKGRTSLSEGYDKPVSGRESWWRKDIRETPVPGSYESQSFLLDFETRPATYSFKGEGRQKPAANQGKGAVLLPGAYEAKDNMYFLDRTRHTYSFRNTSRSKDLPVVKDKHINVCPTSYKMEEVLSMAVEKTPSKHMVFKSNSQRFPTIYFKGTKNPAPCHYEYREPEALHKISSSFKSRTPRFSTSHTKVPGPGTYEKTYQSPMPATISKMGRNHGLFFTSAFSV